MQRGLKPTLHLAKLKLICYANLVFANPFFGSQRDADVDLCCSLPETTLYSQITRTFPRTLIACCLRPEATINPGHLSTDRQWQITDRNSFITDPDPFYMDGNRFYTNARVIIHRWTVANHGSELIYHRPGSILHGWK
jgi:hypothetical protein